MSSSKKYNAPAAKQIEIPFQPRRQQGEMFEALRNHRFVTAVCHRRFGKTVGACIWLILEALASGVPDFRGYYIAPNQKQAKRVVWNYFKKFLRNFEMNGLVKFNETELRIDFISTNGSIYLAGSENIEALRGVYIDRGVFDEMASWTNPQYGFYEVLYPAMSDRVGRAIIIGTVKGLDLFHEFYQMGLDPTFPEWHSLMYDIDSTDVFSAAEKLNFQRMMKPDAYAREYKCDWYAETPDSLISAQELYDAVGRDVHEQAIRAFPEIWGFDCGYQNDPSVLARRKGALLKPFIELRNKDSVFQARWLKDQIEIHKPNAIYVDAGYGEGVIAQLNDLGFTHIVFPIWFNGKSPRADCVNMRAYMYKMLKGWLPTGCVPKHEKFIKQASNQLLDDSDLNRRIKLRAKKEIKELLGYSPDHSDAAALTLAGGGEDKLNAEQIAHMANPEDVTIDMIKAVLGGKHYNPDTYLDDMLDGFSIDKLDTMW
jgi:hypothetical protein